MITIKELKEIRESLGLTHIIIFGVDEKGMQHVATHGKTITQAKEASEMGNNLKRHLKWPEKLCNLKPLERICQNCTFWQRGYHRPGDVIESNMHGSCMYSPAKAKRFEQDNACGSFEPRY